MVKALYRNNSENAIKLALGTGPGNPPDRFDAEPGEVVEGPGVPAYVEAFTRAGYTVVTEEELIKERVAALLAEAQANELAKAEEKAKEEAKEEAAEAKRREDEAQVEAEVRAEQAKAREVEAQVEAEQPQAQSPVVLEDLPIAKPIEKVKARGTHR